MKTNLQRGAGPLGGGGALLLVDPRARILAAAATAAVVVALDDFKALGAGLVMALAMAPMAQLSMKGVLKRILAMDAFILFIIAILPFTVPGQPLFFVAGFPASLEGFFEALRIALRANTITLALMAFVGSMESGTFGHALHRLRVPENLVHLLLFTVRYTDVLYQEHLRLRRAMKVRGFRPANNRHTYVSHGYLIGMMLVRAFERSERILAAMKCRGFTGRFPLLDNMRYARRDLGFALAVGCGIGFLIFLEALSAAPY